jgi:hypothetical protein
MHTSYTYMYGVRTQSFNPSVRASGPDRGPKLFGPVRSGPKRSVRSATLLRILKNLYGQKQAGRVWYQHLVRGLKKLGFVQSTVDECVFYYGTCVLLVYVDDTIVLGPLEDEVQRVVAMLRQQFNIGEEGDICEYLGIKVTKRKDNTITLTQPHLIESILKDLQLLNANAKGRITPALSSVLLHQDLAGDPFDKKFHYRSVIGKLNFLEKSTRPEIAYAVHQCARFTANPRKSHGEAVKRIGRYLLATKEKGIILQPSREKLFDCWVDASHAGEWNKKDAMDNPDTAKS